MINFLNKKGDFEPAKSLPGLILGLIIFVMGLFPILNKFNVISFDLPFTPAGVVLAVILSAGGLYLMIMGFMEDHEDFMRWTSIIAGLITLFLGVIPLLGFFGIVITIPFLSILYNSFLYVVVGLLMIIGSFLM